MSDKKPNETDQFRKAQQTSQEELEHRYKGAVPATGLPTTFRDAEGRVHMHGRDTRIVQPSRQEIASLTDAREVCGHCKYFDLENGRKEIIRQRFGEKLVKEFEWKLRHLGAPIDAMALCGASGGQTAVAFVSKSCDQFQKK